MGKLDDLMSGRQDESVPMSTSFTTSEAERVNDACIAIGAKSRSDFLNACVLDGVEKIETKMGGRDKLSAAADKVDPEGTRHERRTRTKK